MPPDGVVLSGDSNVYITKSERIPLAGSYGLLLLYCSLLLSLIRDYNNKEKEPNFTFPIDVVARGNQRYPNTNNDGYSKF